VDTGEDTVVDVIEQVEDPIERLAAYRPTATTIDAEWSPSDRARLRAALLATRATPPARLRFVPRRRWSLAVPLSSVAILALMVGIALVVAPSDQGAGQAGGTPFVAAGITPTPRVGTDEYAYRATESYQVSADGTAEPVRGGAAEQQLWIEPGGSVWIAQGCIHRRGPTNYVGFDAPTQALFDEMPTNEVQLTDYLRSHVAGSTSRDEAMFVAAGDSLRTADLLASSALRAAWVEVLSHSSRVTVHPDARDYLNRPAVRVDFVDQTQRPGELSSLYFDQQTFQLLEERSGRSGAPDSYNGPSPAWNGPVPPGQPDSGGELTGPATITVVTEEKVVDHLPGAIQNCGNG
jgi:hypothetical protein